MYEFWVAFPEWNHRQAAALILGLDPKRTDLDRIKSFVNILQLLRSDVEAGNLDEGSAYTRPDKIPPRVVAAWFKSKGWDLPTELEEALRKAPEPQSKAQPNAREKELQDKVIHLESELAKVRKLLKDPSRRKNLYLELLGSLLSKKWPDIFEDKQGISRKAASVGMNHHSFQEVLKDVDEFLKAQDPD
jgi:hypothetical protein